MNPETASALAGIVMPLVLSVIIQTGWSKAAQELAAFAACGVAAGVIAWLDGSLSGQTPVEAFGILYAATRASYLALWKPTDIAPRIERATSPQD